jgi:hypothetical protein
MDSERMKTVLEAQFVMGHYVPSGHTAMDRTTIVDWSWDESLVRQALNVALNEAWDAHVLNLEMNGLAVFGLYAPPIYHDENGNEVEVPGWRDEPRSNWGSVSIYAPGILKLATWYRRPFVQFHQAPAVLTAHWQLIQAETLERSRNFPRNDAEQELWDQQWPEAARSWKARLEEHERKWREEP